MPACSRGREPLDTGTGQAANRPASPLLQPQIPAPDPPTSDDNGHPAGRSADPPGGPPQGNDLGRTRRRISRRQPGRPPGEHGGHAGRGPAMAEPRPRPRAHEHERSRALAWVGSRGGGASTIRSHAQRHARR
eukprot:4622763-Pyramimonas_sp.AAC.2